MRKLLGIVLLLAIAVAAWHQHDTAPATGPTSGISAPSATPAATPHRDGARAPQGLPAEAADALARIAAGGPFEHAQDGTVFGNYEGLLPRQPRGYYHEYTVETPGARTRGARRIITGGTPPQVYYYTDDHYRSFRRIEGHR
jgi:guanyl-specific ribonuclease Sa